MRREVFPHESWYGWVSEILKSKLVKIHWNSLNKNLGATKWRMRCYFCSKPTPTSMVNSWLRAWRQVIDFCSLGLEISGLVWSLFPANCWNIRSSPMVPMIMSSRNWSYFLWPTTLTTKHSESIYRAIFYSIVFHTLLFSVFG